jgi:D-alanyl-D-alanine carboxypeptidase (penicillin-binding protein 5/6)
MKLRNPVTFTGPETLNVGNGLLTSASVVPLKTGQVVTVRDLLYALLLPSADDSAWVLANAATGGHSATFIAEMNQAAQRLQMRHTHYVDPDGVSRYSESSARDLIKLTDVAMKIPEFRALVGTKTEMTPFGKLTNLNQLLWQYPGAIGVKTGWTPWAGSCLVFGATRTVGGHPLTVYGVVLGEPSFNPMFGDTARLLQTAFSLRWHVLIPAHMVVASAQLDTVFGPRTYGFETSRSLGAYADAQGAHLQFRWTYHHDGWQKGAAVGQVRVLANGFAPAPWVNVLAQESFHQPWWGGL